MRTSSGCGSSQRLSGGNRDHSVTQFAVIDDENVSALQQVSVGPVSLSGAQEMKLIAFFNYAGDKRGWCTYIGITMEESV